MPKSHTKPQPGSGSQVSGNGEGKSSASNTPNVAIEMTGNNNAVGKFSNNFNVAFLVSLPLSIYIRV